MPSINIDPATHIYLSHFKNEYGSYERILKHIVDENTKLKSELSKIHKEYKDKINQLKDELNNERNFIKEAHLASVSRPILLGQSQAQMTPVMQANLPHPPPTSISSPPRLPPKPIQNISSNVKNDFQKEIKQLFTGELLLPSMVEQINEFDKREMKEAPEEIPDIEIISVTKDNPKFAMIKEE